MKFEIKNRWSNDVIIEVEARSFKAALEIAVGQKADLLEADLRGANLWGADLWGANLRKADLREANLREANLRGADLLEANLRKANLWGADLCGADLWRADLWRADLCGADLWRADLWRADLREAKNFNKYLVTQLLFLKDQPEKIIAYKLVNKENVGPYNGGIVYEVGKEYEEKEADTDEFEQCAKGINLATLDWCIKEWREGYKILLAEFEAKDIASIPVATDGKFRVFRCKIVGEKNLKEIGLAEGNE